MRRKSLFKRAAALALCLTLIIGGITACDTQSTISFETFGAPALSAITVNSGQEVTLPNPTWPHYTFEGWFYDSEFKSAAPSPFKAAPGGVTLYARFTPVTGYVISFYDDNNVKMMADYGAPAGAPITAPETPVKDGSIFLGWFTESGEPFTFNLMPHSDVTLFARWRPDNALVPVNFYGNNRLLATKYVEPGDAVSPDGVIGAEYEVTVDWHTSGGAYNFEQPVEFAEKLDIHAEYRTKTLVVSAQGVVTGYTGTTLSAVIVTDSTITAIGASAFSGKTRVAKVYLDGEVTAIGGSAFKGCTALTNIYGTDKAETVGAEAFYGCTRLTRIELDSAQEIGANAFYGNTALSVAVLGESLQSVGERAFINCKALASVVFYESLTEIGGYAFQNCVGLKAFSVPEGTEMGEGVLSGCSALEAFTIYEGGGPAKLVEDDGSIYNLNKTRLVFYNGGGATSYKMPDTVTSVDPTAFLASKSLTSLTLSPNLTAEGSFGILNMCKNLTSLSVADFGEIPYLAHLYGATEGTQNGAVSSVVPTNLKTFNLTGGAEVIPDYAFYGCIGLTAVNGIAEAMEIGKYAFAFTKFLTEFAVGDGLVKVGVGAFAGSTVTGFTKSGSGGPFDIGDGSYLYNAADGEKALIRAFPSAQGIDLTAFSGILTVGDHALENYTGLTSLTVPGSVEYIGKNALAGCRDLKNLTMPVDGILTSDRSFSDITDGTSVILDSLTVTRGTVIPASAFNAVQITTVVLPAGVTSIGSYAFRENAALTSISPITSVTSIGAGAFQSCSALAEITFGDSLEYINNSAFFDTALTAVEFPASLISIGDTAFAGSSLKTISFRSGAAASVLDEIGVSAFPPGLSGVLELPAALTAIQYGAFAGASVSELSFAGTPSAGLAIGVRAFQRSKFITADFSNTNLTEIGDDAFYNCAVVTEIKLPDAGTLTKIGNSAFIYCYMLSTITLPASVKDVGQRILDDTKWAQAQPEGVMYKDHVAVGYQGSIPADSSITLNSKPYETPITTVCSRLFWSTGYAGPNESGNPIYIPFTHANIVSITVPQSYVYICNNAFTSLPNLTSVTLGKDVEYIGQLAVSGCPKLTTVEIGENGESALKVIDALAFSICGALSSFVINKTINAPAEAPELNVSSRNGMLTVFASEYTNTADRYPVSIKKVTISVPAGSKDYYTHADAWGSYITSNFIIVNTID